MPAFIVFDAPSAGSQTFVTSGAWSFVVPDYDTLTLTAKGAGGGGGAAAGNDTDSGNSGTATTCVQAAMTANGGAGAPGVEGGPDGANGTASGGTVNTTGGHANSGGAGRGSQATAPGDGGDGGLCSKVFTAGELAVGSTLSGNIGKGGAGGYAQDGDGQIGDPTARAGAGLDGRIEISWS